MDWGRGKEGDRVWSRQIISMCPLSSNFKLLYICPPPTVGQAVFFFFNTLTSSKFVSSSLKPEDSQSPFIGHHNNFCTNLEWIWYNMVWHNIILFLIPKNE